MSARTILAGLTGLFLLCLLGCGGGSASPSPAVSVSISPLAAAVAVGSTQQFTAAVSGATNQAVTWSVNGVAGGNSTVGTISISGSYTAPSTVPSPATVTVVATSQATSSAAASASVSLSYPIPSVTAVTPSSITASASGALITVTGQNFVPVSTVNLGATSLATTFVSGTQLKASVPGGTATIGGNYLVTITNPAPGGGPSTTSANLAIAPSIVSVQPANGSVGSAFSITTLGGDPSNLTNNSVAFAQTGRTFSAIVTAASKQGGGVVLTATVPAGLAPASPTALLSAPATVSMATGGVVAGSNTSFTIQPPPHAHAISPPSAEKGTSLPVALQGAFTSFDSSTRLTTDAPELLVSNITVQAPNLITANLTVAAGAAAGAHTLAATSGGASISFTFTVLAPSGNPLTLSSLSATSLAPMAPITLQGSGFAAGGQAGRLARTRSFTPVLCARAA